MSERRPSEFSWLEGLALCLSMISVQLMSEVINQWGMYFYSPSQGVGRTVYVAIGQVSIIFVTGTIWLAIASPLVGFWSDKVRTRPGWMRILPIAGRRRPFIFWGSIGTAVTMIAFWYPPVAETSSANIVYGTVLLCLHWSVFTIALVPLNALAPEIARSEHARLRIGAWIAAGMIVGLAMAELLPGLLIDWLDPTDIIDPETGDPVHSPAGYRHCAALFALISLALFQLPVWLIRERYDSEVAREKAAPMREQFLAVATNRPLIVYSLAIFLFTIGFLAAQRALPYWAELGLHGDESTVSYLLAPFIVTAFAAVAVTPKIADRLGIKNMYLIAFLFIITGLPMMYVLGKVDLSDTVKTVLGGALFGYCGIGQGIIYVMMTPVIGEIIDYDELQSGCRRESLYNGLTSLAWSISGGGAVIVASTSMNLWGNAAGNFEGVLLIGPIASFFGILGFLVMLAYPKLNVAREAPGEQPGT